MCRNYTETYYTWQYQGSCKQSRQQPYYHHNNYVSLAQTHQIPRTIIDQDHQGPSGSPYEHIHKMHHIRQINAQREHRENKSERPSRRREDRSNQYYRRDGEKINTIQQQSAPVKTKDELLRELFLQYNIDLKNSRKLGSGRYSTVFTASYVHSGDKSRDIRLEQVAIKVINTQKVTDEFRNKFLPREIECWNRLIHPNLVRMLGYYRAKDHVFLTMEFGRGGDMLQYVQNNGPVHEYQASFWMSQIIAAVRYMHENGIAHRDLKLENIILFPNQGIKISDFGFAKVVGDHLSQTYCGSRSYSAPEILIGEPYSPFKADVWSVGVIGFIIVTDSMPYRENQANPKIVEAQKNRAYSFPSNLKLSEECQYSINMMMTFSWIERPDIQQCWQLPWIYDCST